MDWLALLVVPALWAQAVYASPFLKTGRHGLSLGLAVIAGLLMFGSLRMSNPASVALFIGGSIAIAAMIVSLLWKIADHKPKRNVR